MVNDAPGHWSGGLASGNLLDRNPGFLLDRERRGERRTAIALDTRELADRDADLLGQVSQGQALALAIFSKRAGLRFHDCIL